MRQVPTSAKFLSLYTRFTLLSPFIQYMMCPAPNHPECIDTSELVAQTQLEAQSAEISGVKVNQNMGRAQEFMSV